MQEIILDTILDAVKLLPFLFVTFLFIELLEHKMDEKMHQAIRKSDKVGPLVGSTLGIIPQCGISVAVTNLYITRIVTLGTLISVYLATSDEMLPILISNKVNIATILFILLIKWISGIVFGFLIDLVIRKKEESLHDLCEGEHCSCEEGNIFLSAVIHTIKTLVFILITTFILNVLFNLIGENNIKNLFTKESYLSVLLSPLVGLIPSCAASIALTEFYLTGVIKLSACIAGLLTSSGVATLVLLKTNKDKKESLKIIGLLYLIGALVGSILFIFNI